jgi:hypothetical protein
MFFSLLQALPFAMDKVTKGGEKEYVWVHILDSGYYSCHLLGICRSELHTSRDRRRKVRIFEPSQAFDTPLSMPLKSLLIPLPIPHLRFHGTSKPPSMPL